MADMDGLYRIRPEGRAHPYERGWPTLDRAWDMAIATLRIVGRVWIERDGKTVATIHAGDGTAYRGE